MTTEVSIDLKRAIDYETIFVLRPDIDSDASEKAIARVVGVIEQSGGKLLRLESWGKRRLAYEIRKNRKGFYVYVRYLGYRGTVAEIERNLRLLDTVLRFLTTVIRRDVDPASVSVDPEETKVRRIEISESEDDREEAPDARMAPSDDEAARAAAEAQPAPTAGEEAPATPGADSGAQNDSSKG